MPVNAGDHSITLSSHGWLDNQAVILGRTGNSDVPNGIAHPDFEGADARLYYVKRKDANNFWLYDKPLTKGGKLVPVSPNGSQQLQDGALSSGRQEHHRAHRYSR
jgi:hypothetical protein